MGVGLDGTGAAAGICILSGVVPGGRSLPGVAAGGNTFPGAAAGGNTFPGAAAGNALAGVSVGITNFGTGVGGAAIGGPPAGVGSRLSSDSSSPPSAPGVEGTGVRVGTVCRCGSCHGAAQA